MSRAEYRVGDVFQRMAEIPDGSIDAVICSPPFLALRSYLPADHPDKGKEIGSEPTPAAFLSTLLALTREWRRILTPTGSLCVELGDTYSGSGGAGGDYGDGGWREGQLTFKQQQSAGPPTSRGPRLQDRRTTGVTTNKNRDKRPGWPLDKSLCLIPSLYAASLAYGRNLLNPDDTLEPWRVRNLIVWHRPNPPVGALGDKVRPSTSYVTVACTAKDRWFDLDAERGPGSPNTHARLAKGVESRPNTTKVPPNGSNRDTLAIIEGDGGAPPLDCWFEDRLAQSDEPFDTTTEDVWTIPTAPYPGSHYATWNIALPRKLINLMCPPFVCMECGIPLGFNREDPTTKLRGMRDADSRSMGDAPERAQEAAVLFQDMFMSGNGAHPLDDTRMDPGSEGLHPAVSPESSNGDQGWLRNGASGGGGGIVGPDAREDGSGPPHQRDQGRQPCGEPGSDGQAGPRSEAEASGLAHSTMSSLWRVDPGAESCPRCAGRLRRGVVLDPFVGSGTTLQAASELGRDSIGLDLDSRNLSLARSRLGMFLVEEDEVRA